MFWVVKNKLRFKIIIQSAQEFLPIATDISVVPPQTGTGIIFSNYYTRSNHYYKLPVQVLLL